MDHEPRIEQCRAMSSAGWLHGFTTRRGGVSGGPFESLNLGGTWGDDPTAVAMNRERVARAAGFDLATLRLVRQVHGRAVVRIDEGHPSADGLWCQRGDAPAIAAVLTADCVPILLADTLGTACCAIHSGWRGTVANIVGAAVNTLTVEAKVPAVRLMAAIGPCISVRAFEVGPEVAQRVPARFVDRSLGAKPHVDLRGMVHDQLERAGVSPRHIEHVGGCTVLDRDRYFSYRREGRTTGQMLSFVGFAAPTKA